MKWNLQNYPTTVLNKRIWHSGDQNKICSGQNPSYIFSGGQYPTSRSTPLQSPHLLHTPLQDGRSAMWVVAGSAMAVVRLRHQARRVGTRADAALVWHNSVRSDISLWVISIITHYSRSFALLNFQWISITHVIRAGFSVPIDSLIYDSSHQWFSDSF